VNHSFCKILRSSEGLTLFMVIFVMAFFLLFVTGALFLAQVDLKKTSNLKLAVQAVEVADAGLQHALALVPWVLNFNDQLNCGAPPCSLVSNSFFGSGFSYTVTVQNDLTDINNGGSATNDTNNTVLVTSVASGPNGSKKVVEAYIRRSLSRFNPPAALYINGASASPVGTYFFDSSDSIRISGNDTNPGDLLNQSDDTSGPNGPLPGIGASAGAIVDALKNEYANQYNGASLHDIVGVVAEPSIGITGDILDIDKIAGTFLNQPGAVVLADVVTDATNCPTSYPTALAVTPTALQASVADPGARDAAKEAVKAAKQELKEAWKGGDPAAVDAAREDLKAAREALKTLKQGGTASSNCVLGTSSAPQITYISGISSLKGNVTGVGVLVLEGDVTIGGNFRFAGLVVHNRADSTDYISFEDSPWVYGGVLLGSFDENDGQGKKVRFRVQDFSQMLYSSKALELVDTNWGTLLPKPARLFAWVDK